MKSDFKVRICSDLDFEGMVADISWKNNTVAMISQEKGVKDLEIEIYPSLNNESWKFSLSEFVEIIQFAKSTLIDGKIEENK